MQRVHVEGLRELDQALKQLPKATGKAVLRRVLLKRAEPMRATAEAKAPRDTGGLARSATKGTKLSKRQRALHKGTGGPRLTADGWKSDAKSEVEVFVGFPSSPKSIVQEFGSSEQSPQPFMRPAWDANKMGILEGLKDDLWAEVKKTAERRAKRLARQAAKG